MPRETRSPFKAGPLRNPGQSLEERRAEILEDQLLTPMIAASVTLIFAAIEWYRHFFPSPPQPVGATFFAVLFAGYVAFRTWRRWPKLKALRLGLDGERAVGQFLESLRTKGYKVFHDIPGNNFNIDHVLIGPAGVFAIETKTYSKPLRGSPKVVCEGARLLVDGFAPDRDPVIQSKAQASWLRELLAQSTGKAFPVRPVIVFPGWFVEQDRASRREFWVLEPKALESFLDHEPATLLTEDVTLAAFHLSRYIRTS